MIKFTDEQKLELIDITNKAQWDGTLVLCKLIDEDWYLEKENHKKEYLLKIDNANIQIQFNEKIIIKWMKVDGRRRRL